MATGCQSLVFRRDDSGKTPLCLEQLRSLSRPLLAPSVCLDRTLALPYTLTRQACRTLANISFGNQYTALRLLEAGADRAACDLVRDSDKTSHSDIMEAVMSSAGLRDNFMRLSVHVFSLAGYT